MPTSTFQRTMTLVEAQFRRNWEFLRTEIPRLMFTQRITVIENPLSQADIQLFLEQLYKLLQITN